MAASLRLTPAEAEALTPSRLMSRKVRRPLLVAVALKAGLTKSETPSEEDHRCFSIVGWNDPQQSWEA